MPRVKRSTEVTPAIPKPPLPHGWQWVRFDQIAINVSDRVDDPRTAGVDHYVGLEHLDSDSLKIRRWGTPDDVEAQKLRFRAGDIIFGKRRAYQRKVGVAEFDGICSAHAFVFRGNQKYIVPELLPFFMQTDAFMERAVAISKGSLSPTINWGDLARQEFALPSDPGEQRRIAELLRAADEAVEAWRAVGDCESLVMQSLAEDLFGPSARKYKRLATSELLTVPVQNGVSPETNASGEGFPSIALSAVQNGLLNAEGHTKYGNRSPLRDQLRSRTAGPVGFDGLIQEVEDRALLQLECLRHCEDALDEAAAVVAVAAEGVLPPQLARPQLAFHMIVCRLDVIVEQELPQRRFQFQQVLAECGGLLVRAA